MLLKNPKRFINKIADYKLKNSNLKYLVQALEKIHPNHWDFGTYDLENIDEYKNILEYKEMMGFNYYFTIHYPELVITNGKQKHTIYDLYIKLKFIDFGTPRLADIRGLRTSATVGELSSGYIHSHLPSGYGYAFKSFCLGGGPIRDYLGSSLSSVEGYEYFLYLLQSYLEWESKAGIPYINMDSIFSYAFPSIDFSYPREITNNYNFHNLKSKIQSYGIEIIPDENIEQQIFEILKGLGWSTYLCYKTPSGKYVSTRKINSQMDYSSWEGRIIFKFKNQDVQFKLINKENDVKFEYNAPIPELTQKVCEFLSRKLTKKQITNSRIKKENKITTANN